MKTKKKKWKKKRVHRNNARAPYKPTVYMEVHVHVMHTRTHTTHTQVVFLSSLQKHVVVYTPVRRCSFGKILSPTKRPISLPSPPYVAFHDHVQVCANCAIGQFTNDITIMRSVLIPQSPKIMLPSTKHRRASQRLPKPTRYQRPRDPPW